MLEPMNYYFVVKNIGDENVGIFTTIEQAIEKLDSMGTRNHDFRIQLIERPDEAHQKTVGELTDIITDLGAQIDRLREDVDSVRTNQSDDWRR